MIVSDNDLLGAALDAFAAKGYDATSVREIARELGVSHNLIPQRFGSKERLWYAAIDHGFAMLAADLMEVATESPDDELGQLRALVLRFVAANSLRPALVRIINREASTPGPRLDYLYDAYIDPVRESGATVLSELRASGKLRTDSVALMYFFMTHGACGPLALPALAERFGQAIDPSDRKAVLRHASEAVDVLFEGLITRP